jgi:hypothetical protein
VDGGGHDLGGRRRGKGRLRWQGRAREIEYIIASNHIPLIRVIERLILSKSDTTTSQGISVCFFKIKSKSHTHGQPHSFSVFQNAIVRSKGDKQTYYGHEIPLCTDRSSLHYRLPCEKVEYASGYNFHPISSPSSRVTSSTGTHRRQSGMECSADF